MQHLEAPRALKLPDSHSAAVGPYEQTLPVGKKSDTLHFAPVAAEAGEFRTIQAPHSNRTVVTLRAAAVWFDDESEPAEAARSYLELARLRRRERGAVGLAREALLAALQRADRSRRDGLIASVERELAEVDEVELYKRLYLRARGRGIRDDIGAMERATGERATVPFLDLRESTLFVMREDPAVVRLTLNQLFAELTEVLLPHKVVINQYLGDGFMALLRAGNHALNAVAGGLEMLEALGRFNRPRKVLGLRPLEARIGISTGDVVAPRRPRGSGRTTQGNRRAGSRAQEILKPFLEGRDPGAYLFSPAEARLGLNTAKKAGRKPPLWPSHLARQASKKKANPQRAPRDHYDRHSYAHAVARAAKKAGVPHWHPHQLKHATATEVRNLHGVEDARVYVGHNKLSTTEIYAEKRPETCGADRAGNRLNNQNRMIRERGLAPLPDFFSECPTFSQSPPSRWGRLPPLQHDCATPAPGSPTRPAGQQGNGLSVGEEGPTRWTGQTAHRHGRRPPLHHQRVAGGVSGGAERQRSCPSRASAEEPGTADSCRRRRSRPTEEAVEIKLLFSNQALLNDPYVTLEQI